MRIHSLLLTSILVLISPAAGDTLQKWSEIATKSRSNVIRLDVQTFDQLVTTERNYTAISASPVPALFNRLVALTALQPQYQCALCREFDPEFSTVAESWRKAHPKSDGVFFGRLDFAEGQPIFVRVRFMSRTFLTGVVWPSVCTECMGLSSNVRSSFQAVLK